MINPTVRQQLRERFCRFPNKVRYWDKDNADAALALIARDPNWAGPFPTRSYYCPCGGWHLTSMSRAEQPQASR